MKISDINLGDELMCTRICPISDSQYPNHFKDTEFNRAVGFIGYVSAIFPLTDSVYLAHMERDSTTGTYNEFLTSFFADELEPFDPPTLAEDTPLRKSIDKFLVQITRE